MDAAERMTLMSYTSLDLTGLLGTGLNTSSNPDPNTLATKNPYPSPFINPMSVSSAWTTQAKKALFPLGIDDSAIKLHFVPSGGASIVYTVVVWVYNKLSNSWTQPAVFASNTYTGEKLDYLENPGNDPIFLQISSISSGTLSVYFDSSLALAL
jgi:hypothetical protein